MVKQITEETLREWIDDELVAKVERTSDPAAEFNLLLEMSNLNIHVIRRRSDGPVLIGQEIAYDEGIQTRIQQLSAEDRNELIARIRETLTTVPVIYGFTDADGMNVQFQDLDHIFLECRIYPDELSQGQLMARLIDVWKAMRYLDDLVGLLEAVEGRHV